MKKIISLILCAVLLFSLVACKGTTSDDTKETTEKKETEETKKDQADDKAEYKSEARFTDAELFTFKSGGKDLVAEKGYVISILEDSFGVSFKFGEKDAKPYSAVATPFGATVGDSLDKLIEKHDLDSGYAAYVKKGGAFVMYEEKENVDITDGKGGCIYFGYAKDVNGEWAFMDYLMLTQVIEGKFIVKGNDGDYDVVVYSCIVDDSKNVTKITQLYGEINSVMAQINGK